MILLCAVQAAGELLSACVACKRSSLAIQLYRQLAAAGNLSPSVHAAGLAACLQRAAKGQGGPQDSSQVGSQELPTAGSPLHLALAVLEGQGEALLQLHDAELASAVGDAAVAALGRRGRPWGTGVLDCYLQAAAVAEAEGSDAAQVAVRQYELLRLPVRLALWGLRLLAASAEGGQAPASKGGKQAADAQSQLPRLAAAVAAGGRSAQLLLFLQLLPTWTEGRVQPTDGEWRLLLRCAHDDDVLGPLAAADGADAGRAAQASVACQLRLVCEQLREHDPCWATGLSTPAKVSLSGLVLTWESCVV